MPTAIWSSSNAATVQKYLRTASCDGNERLRRSGSSSGISPWGGSAGCVAYQKAIKPMPASSAMMLTPVQTIASPVGRLPINGSCGQLLV